MGFIRVRLEGHKKHGGYLTIMEQMSYDALKWAEKKLTDGEEIFLPNGPQTIRFDPVGLYKREKATEKTFNARMEYKRSNNDYYGQKLDNYSNAVSEEANLPGKIDYTLTVESNTLLTIVVTSDYKGDIVGDPAFLISLMSDEELAEMERKAEEKRILAEKRRAEDEQRQKEEAERRKQELKKEARVSVIKSIILFIFSAILIIISKKTDGWLSPVTGLSGLAGGIWSIKIFFSNIFSI